MSRYIDADELERAVRGWDMQDLYLPVHFLDLLEEIPTADVAERKSGEWVSADIEQLSKKLESELTLEEYQQLSALMFQTLDKIFFEKVREKK